MFFLSCKFKYSCTYCTIYTMFLSTLHITQSRWPNEQILWHGIINNLNSLCPCGLAFQSRPKINSNITLKQMKILYKNVVVCTPKVLPKWIAVVCFYPLLPFNLAYLYLYFYFYLYYFYLGPLQVLSFGKWKNFAKSTKIFLVLWLNSFIIQKNCIMSFLKCISEFVI